MSTSRTASLVTAFILTASVDLLAQQQEPPVSPGDRVRVTAPEVFRGRIVGSIVSMSGDTCVFRPEGRAQVAIPLASVTSLEISRGRTSNLVAGIAIGLLTGGAAGAVTGLALCGEGKTEATAAQCAGIFGGIGAGAGLVLGTAIGASSSGDRWESVPLDRLRVSMVPRRDGGLAIRVSLAF